MVLAYNIQRQQITFSEKAFAYKMKNEAMKRTGGRRKSSQSDYPLKGKKTVEIIGEEFGDSAKQVQRYKPTLVTRQGAVVLAYNLQRQQITFSEKAFAYKMKNEAMKRTGGRRKSSQSDYPLKGKKTVEIIGEEFGDSAKQVQRYLKLTDLISELLEKLDNGELSFNPAVELSYLTIEEQKEFIDAMEYTQAVPSISQAQRIKKLSREKKLTGTKMREIMGEIKKGEITRVMFNNEQLYRYFPKSYTPAEMKEEILSICHRHMS